MSAIIQKLSRHSRIPDAAPGQALMEYALILVLIAAVCVIVLTALGDQIVRAYDVMLCEIEGSGNCTCDARESFIVGPDFVCAGNSFSFQTLTSCRDRTELALQIEHADGTSDTYGLLYDEQQRVFYTSFTNASLCTAINGSNPPLGTIISEHKDNTYLNSLPFSFSGPPPAGDPGSGGSDPGGSDPGGSDPGGSDPGGSDPGGSDPGGSDPGGSDPGGSDPGGGEVTAPTIPDIAPVTMQELDTATIGLSATPAGGSGTVTFSAMNLVETWMTFTDNGDNTASLVLSPLEGHAGSYDVTVVATSPNGTSSSQTFNITVEPAPPNNPPTVAPISDQTVEVGSTAQIPVYAIDPDGDPVTISVQGLNSFITYNSSNARINVAPTTAGHIGTYTVTVNAEDNRGGTGSRSFTITVNAAVSPRVEDGLLALYRFGDQFVSNNAVPNLAVADAGSNLTLYPGTRAGSTVVEQLPYSVRLNAGIDTASNTHGNTNTAYIQSGNISSLVEIIGGSQGQSSHAFTMEMWIKPHRADQGGFARIFTLSQDTGTSRNFTLGHGTESSGNPANNLTVRIRTRVGNNNNTISGANVTAATLNTEMVHHLVYTRANNGTTRIYLNGVEVSQTAIGGTGNLRGWNTSYRLTLGNEATGDRPWAGEFFLVAIYDRALTAAEVQTNFNAAEPWK